MKTYIYEITRKIAIVLCGITFLLYLFNVILCSCMNNGYTPEEETLYITRELMEILNILYQIGITCSFLIVLYLFSSYIISLFH